MKPLKSTILLCCALIISFSVQLKGQSYVEDEKEEKPISKFIYSIQAGIMFYDALDRDVDIDLTLNMDYSIRTSLGYQLSPKVSAGVITGLDEYPSTTLIPVGVFIDGKVGKSTVRWYNRVNTGYAFTSSDTQSQDGGAFINFETGLWIKTTRKGSLVLTLGHHRQKANQTLKDVYRYPGVGDLYKEFSYRRVVFNVGYSTRI